MKPNDALDIEYLSGVDAKQESEQDKLCYIHFLMKTMRRLAINAIHTLH